MKYKHGPLQDLMDTGLWPSCSFGKLWPIGECHGKKGRRYSCRESTHALTGGSHGHSIWSLNSSLSA